MSGSASHRAASSCVYSRPSGFHSIRRLIGLPVEPAILPVECAPPTRVPPSRSGGRASERVRHAGTAPGTPGFTLLELLMVIAIILVLMGLLGAGIAMVRQRVFAAQAVSRVTQLQWALDNYATEDRRHRYPAQTGPADFTIRFDPSGGAPGNFNALVAAGHQPDLNHFDRSVPPPWPLLDPWKRPYGYRVDDDLMAFATPQRPLDLPGWNSKGVRPWAYLWSTGRKATTDGEGWIYVKDDR